MLDGHKEECKERWTDRQTKRQTGIVTKVNTSKIISQILPTRQILKFHNFVTLYKGHSLGYFNSVPGLCGLTK